ncbi:MAG: hypothetical protein Q8P22_11660 [Chloroflexota bacterium]|nr:hypothetical protein [Chloroflexota bacterium]
MKFLSLALGLVLAALAVPMVGGGTALFTSQVQNPGNTFTTASSFPLPWWDTAYAFRRQITVATGANTPYKGYDDYSVQLGVDTASLVGSGKLQADCDDLRLAYWNGSSWVELNRDAYACNGGSTELWFKLQADIPASSSDDDYYLYYGNPLASSPPADRSEVYLHYNNWSSNRLGEYAIGRQDAWHGTGTYAGFSWDGVNQRVNFNTGDNFTGGLRLAGFGERDLYVEQVVRYIGCYPSDVTQGLTARYSGDGTSSDNWYAFVQANSSGCSVNPYTNPAMQKDNRTDAGFCGSGAGTAWALDGSLHRQGFAMWGVNPTSMKGWLDKSPRKPVEASDLACSDAAATDHENAGDVAWVQAQTAGSFDDFLVRRYTEPEPTTSLGTEESAP